jgi:hypothetical protein
VVEDELGRLGCAQVPGGVTRKSVEQENTGSGCSVCREFAKSLPDPVGQGVPGPPYGVGGGGVKSVGLGQVAGSQLVVPRDENGAQVSQELEARERFSPVTHYVPEVPEGVDTLLVHVGDDRFEGREVSMDIR